MENPGSLIEQQAEIRPPALKRPGSVTILALGVLIITILNLTRLVLSLRDWDFLASWPGISPWYVAITGLIWSLVGVPLVWGLWKTKKWAPQLMRTFALTYALYYWLEQVFLIDHPVIGTVEARRALLPVNWQFAAGVTVICLGFIAWTLNRRKVKEYFGLVVEEDTGRDKSADEDII